MKTDYLFDNKKHIHTLREKPLMGTTTLIKEVMPPMLAYYGSGMACKTLGWFDRKKGRANYLPEEKGMPILAQKLGEIQKMSPEEYLQFLDEAYIAHDVYKKEKGDWGTDLHELIEYAIKEAINTNGGYLKSEPYENPDVEQFAKWGRGKKFLYSEVHVYSEFLWLGGIIDFIYQDLDGIHIGDLKTSKSIYGSHFVQVGLYDCQQQENGFYLEDGTKIGDAVDVVGYTVVNIPQNGKLKHITYRGVQQLREFGPNLVQLYKILQELKIIIS